MIRVSVIVPLFNKAATVRRTLRSIGAQTYTHWEAIVVDDGSTDDGPSIVEGMGDSRFRLIRQTNAGPGAARNRGLRESHGEYVAFLDADDEWKPEYLAKAVGILDDPSSPAAVTSGWWEEPLHRKGPAFADRLQPGLYRVTPEWDAQQLVERLIVFSPCSTVGRREVVEAYGGFYDQAGCRYGEDAHLWLKVLLNEPCYLSLEPLAVFHRDASELSGNLRDMRPIEPFLLDPEDVRKVCPEALRPLLERFLSYRAQKTACLLSYWGQWKRGSELWRGFHTNGSLRLPWFFPCWIATTWPTAWAVQILASVHRRGKA